MRILGCLMLLGGLVGCGRPSAALPEPTPGETPLPLAGTVAPTEGPWKEVPYTPQAHPAQRLDIYPARDGSPGPHPVVMYVHGGAWAWGDKSRVGFKAEAFTQNGYLFVSLNYRLSPEATWQEMAQDVALAVAWVKAHIGAYGGDPERIFLLGHSAGAHLVTLVATDETYLRQAGLDLSALRGVVALDTQAYDLTALAQPGERLPRLYARIFGADPQVWRQASPSAHVAPGKGIPPMALAWSGGLAGGQAAERAEVTRAFAQALQEAGVEVLLLDGSAKTHGAINRDFGRPGDPLTAQVMAWLAHLNLTK